MGWKRLSVGDEGICGVLVSYHPDAEVLRNLEAVRAQVQGLVVVDNGSSAEELALLRGVMGGGGFELMENGTNLGIATALNLGVRWAQAQGFRWVLLLDQDSRVTEGFVAAMRAGWARNAPGGRLAILVPRYVDSRFGTVLAPPVAGGGGLQAATTSGSLMPLAVFEDAGWFWDELFIDGVDYEYSLRVRELGYGIQECVEAVLLHSPATPSYHQFLGKRVQAGNYSPVRRYYQERNKILVCKRHWRGYAGFLLGQFLISGKDLGKIVLLEGGKGEKVRMFGRGIWDGLRGRMGKLG